VVVLSRTPGAAAARQPLLYAAMCRVARFSAPGWFPFFLAAGVRDRLSAEEQGSQLFRIFFLIEFIFYF